MKKSPISIKKIISFSIFIIFFIFLSNLISAVNNCDADLNFNGSPAGDGTNNNTCLVPASLTLNGTYTIYMNGSANGVMVPQANNLIIDCNGSTIIGNYTTGTTETTLFFGKASGNNNLTWKNCIIKNFYSGIGFRSSETSGAVINCTFNNSYQPVDIMTGRNILVANSTFIKTDYYGVFLEPNSNLWHNITIQGNNFSVDTQRAIRATGHIVNRAKGIIIKDNIISYNGSISSSLWIDYTDNVTITNNIINNPLPSAILGSIGIQLNALNNITISGNNVSGYDKGIGFITDNRAYNIANANWFCGNLTTNVNINNNKLFNNDRGLSLRGVLNSNISTNLFLNNTEGVDAYNVGLYLEECNVNTLIEYNNFSQIGSTGIAITSKTSGVKILNNTFDMLNDSEKSTRGINDIYDYPSAISIVEMYKQFAQGNRTGQPTQYNITFVRIYKSDNITILGNIFDSDTRTFLTLQGTTNVTQDLSNYWYRKWSYVDYLADPIEYYNNNNFDRSYWTNNLGTIKDASSYGYGNTTGVYPLINYNFTKTWAFFNNTDITQHEHLVYLPLDSSRAFWDNGTEIFKIGNNFNVTIPSLRSFNISFLDLISIYQGGGGNPTPTFQYNTSLICKKSYYFVLDHILQNGSLVYTNQELIDLSAQVSSYIGLAILPETLKPIIDNFATNCTGYILPNNYLINNNLTVYPKLVNSINTKINITVFGLSLDGYIPLPRISLGYLSGDAVDILKWIFNIEKSDWGYFINGIKVFTILVPLVLIFLIMILNSNSKLNKALKKYIKR